MSLEEVLFFLTMLTRVKKKIKRKVVINNFEKRMSQSEDNTSRHARTTRTIIIIDMVNFVLTILELLECAPLCFQATLPSATGLTVRSLQCKCVYKYKRLAFGVGFVRVLYCSGLFTDRSKFRPCHY